MSIITRMHAPPTTMSPQTQMANFVSPTLGAEPITT